MTKKVDILLDETSEKGIKRFRQRLQQFGLEHEISDISTTVLLPNSLHERIVATILYE